MDATIRNLALSDTDIELILSALMYLRNMSLTIEAASGRPVVDQSIIEQLEVLIKQFEEQ
jgi:hypothetical protein